MKESLNEIKYSSRLKYPFKRLLGSLRKSKGRDTSVSTTVTLVNEDTTQTPEVQVEIKRFSEEAKQALKDKGYIILELTGRSIKSMKDDGNKFTTVPMLRNLKEWKFYTLCSRKSEVAINPKSYFLLEAYRKTFIQQQEIISNFSEELEREIREVKAIIGEIPEYAEIILAYPNEELFFNKDYSDYEIRTNTMVSAYNIATFRNDGANNGIMLGYCFDDLPKLNGLIAPIVVPA